jgi:hypothetical protein
MCGIIIHIRNSQFNGFHLSPNKFLACGFSGSRTVNNFFVLYYYIQKDFLADITEEHIT